MADAKLTALTNLATVTGDDLVYVVDDPAGTPASRKAAASVVATYCGTVLVNDTAYASSWDGVTTIAPSKNAVRDRFESFDLNIERISGNWYLTSDGGAFATSSLLTNNTIYWSPFFLRKMTSITDLAARVITAVGSAQFQLAIYAASAQGRPTGSELAKTGSLSAASAAAVSGTVGDTVALVPGLYFVGINTDISSTAYLTVPNTAVSRPWCNAIGSATLANVLGSAVTISQVSSPKTFGTWGDVTSDTFTETTSGYRSIIAAMKAA